MPSICWTIGEAWLVTMSPESSPRKNTKNRNQKAGVLNIPFQSLPGSESGSEVWPTGGFQPRGAYPAGATVTSREHTVMMMKKRTPSPRNVHL